MCLHRIVFYLILIFLNGCAFLIDSSKEVGVTIFEVIKDNVSLTVFIVIAVSIIYFLFFANRSVHVESETLLEKQRREVEEKRWELEKRLAHERIKGFKRGFFFTTLFWAMFPVLFLQYAPSSVLKKLTGTLKQPQKTVEVQESKEAGKYRLHVKTIPKNSKIRILNYPDLYQDGMLLPPDSYVIDVKAPGYYTKYECVVIKDKNEEIPITLGKRCCK